MKNFIIILYLLSFIGCKEQVEKNNKTKGIVYDKVRSVKEVIKNFDKGLMNGDSITFDLNLTMEHFIRVDTIIVKKQDKILNISVSTTDKIMDLDDDFKKPVLYRKNYNKKHTDTLSLENFFSQKLSRFNKNNAQTYTAKVFIKSDTIKLYTYNLADKAKFIRGYFAVMKELFPTEKKFYYMEEISP